MSNSIHRLVNSVVIGLLAAFAIATTSGQTPSAWSIHHRAAAENVHKIVFVVTELQGPASLKAVVGGNVVEFHFEGKAGRISMLSPERLVVQSISVLNGDMFWLTSKTSKMTCESVAATGMSTTPLTQDRFDNIYQPTARFAPPHISPDVEVKLQRLLATRGVRGASPSSESLTLPTQGNWVRSEFIPVLITNHGAGDVSIRVSAVAGTPHEMFSFPHLTGSAFILDLPEESVRQQYKIATGTQLDPTEQSIAIQIVVQTTQGNYIRKRITLLEGMKSPAPDPDWSIRNAGYTVRVSHYLDSVQNLEQYRLYDECLIRWSQALSRSEWARANEEPLPLLLSALNQICLQKGVPLDALANIKFVTIKP